MKILTDLNNAISWIEKEVTKVDNGYYIPEKDLIVAEVVNNPIYKLYTVENVPTDVKPSTHCYDGATFTANPNYVAPKPPIENEVETLKAQNAQMLLALVKGGLM